MSEVLIQIDLMIQALLTKKKYLEGIKKYTEHQKELLKKEVLDLRDFNNIMKNKQIMIDKLLEVDQGFNELYQRIKGQLSGHTELYKDSIIEMKRLIKETTDLGVSIQVQESRNKVQFDIKSKGVKSDARTYRSHKSAMDHYTNNYKKQIEADKPYFFDSKK